MAEDASKSIEETMKQAEAERRARESNALLAWANTFLKKKKLHAESLTTDFSDGVLLVNLLEIAFQVRRPSPYKPY
jgi:hypothetical protein